MSEEWRDIPGYEGRYQVSDLGRVKSLPFMQRYLLRNGREAFRRTREIILAQQAINSGYLIVHLHLDNKRTAYLVHRLVALAFAPGAERTVNHKSGRKRENTAANLEWASYSANHIHAVAAGLYPRAQAVEGRGPGGVVRSFPSQSEAAFQLTGDRRNGTKISACLLGKRHTAFGYVWART